MSNDYLKYIGITVYTERQKTKYVSQGGNGFVF